MRRLLSILLIFISCSTICRAQLTYISDKFQVGESFKLDIYYNWGFIWLNAGWATFEIRDTTWNGQKALHLLSKGSTHSGYDWFYKVRDTYEAVVEPKTYSPYWFHCNTNEGGYIDKEITIFNYKDSIAIATTETSKRGQRIDTLKINPNITDLVSAIYKCRSIDFSKIKIDEQVPVPVLVCNKIYNLHFRYLGKEDVTTKDGIIYHCRKFAVMMVDGTIFKGGEDLTAWITDDLNCAPVMMEAKIAVGSVKAFLKEIKGNKWEVKTETAGK